MSIKNYMIILFGTVVLFMLFIWALDTSISSINVGEAIVGFFGRLDPVAMYHLALVGLIGTFLFDVLIFVDFIFDRRHEHNRH